MKVQTAKNNVTDIEFIKVSLSPGGKVGQLFYIHRNDSLATIAGPFQTEEDAINWLKVHNQNATQYKYLISL